jgi:hypothetical protein
VREPFDKPHIIEQSFGDGVVVRQALLGHDDASALSD